MFHERLKYIEIKYYFIRDKFQEGEVKLEYIPTNVTRTEPVIEPVDPKNRNQTGTGKKPDQKTGH